jgi:hypothetical protein
LNSTPSLSAFTGALPAHQDSWEWDPTKGKKKKLVGVLAQVDILVAEGLTGELLLETQVALLDLSAHYMGSLSVSARND